MTGAQLTNNMRAMNTAHAPFDTEADPLPRRGAELPDPQRVRELAESLGCVTEHDVCELARIAPGTLEAWRKRGKGPPYVLFGNRFLYPRDGLHRYLLEHQRARSGVGAKALL